MAMIKKMKKQNTNLNKSQVEILQILALPLDKRIELYAKANEWIDSYHSRVKGKDTRTQACMDVLNEIPEHVRDLYLSCIIAKANDSEI